MFDQGAPDSATRESLVDRHLLDMGVPIDDVHSNEASDSAIFLINPHAPFGNVGLKLFVGEHIGGDVESSRAKLIAGFEFDLAQSFRIDRGGRAD